MKTTAILLIMTFFLLLAVSIIKSKKDEISFLDDLLYFYRQIIIMLSNTAPETDYIINKLSADGRLEKYDLSNIAEFYGADSDNYARICESIETLGRYSAETQIKYFTECAEYFKAYKEQKQAQIDKNRRLYLVLCLFAGITISLFII